MQQLAMEEMVAAEGVTVNFARIATILSGLRILPFFPSDEHALLALVRMVGEMASSEDQVQWLVNRMTSGLYAQWSGPQEMRACFCSRFKPRDGINAYSTVYLDGIPADPKLKAKQIAGPEPKMLTAGAEGAVSADEGMAAAVQIAAKVKGLRNPLSGPATEAEIAAAPQWLRELEGYR